MNEDVVIFQPALRFAWRSDANGTILPNIFGPKSTDFFMVMNPIGPESVKHHQTNPNMLV